MYDFEYEIDPEKHVFNMVTDNCRYYSDDQFNEDVEMSNTFPLIHFICHSLYTNTKINECLLSFKSTFKLIALCETWMNEERGTDCSMEGYELQYINRVNKRGGGVVIHVESDLKCRWIEQMTTVMDDLMECITLEIEMEKWGILVSLVCTEHQDQMQKGSRIVWKN